MRFSSLRSHSGFSLLDMLVVTALIGIVGAMTIPMLIGAMERMRLGQAATEVEREMQSAKQRAIAKGRPIRVRFNCPSTGLYRAVELLGNVMAPTAADDSADRCSITTYPYPAPDNNPITRPNLDGPLRRLDPTVTLTGAQTLEFWPDGTVHYNGGGLPWPMVPTAGVSFTLSRYGKNSNLTVNGVGRIQVQTQR